MTKKNHNFWIIPALLLQFSLFIIPTRVEACACCMPHNYRLRSESVISEFDQKQLSKVTFGSGILVEHMGEADPAILKNTNSLSLKFKSHTANTIVFEVHQTQNKTLNKNLLTFKHTNLYSTLITDTHNFNDKLRDTQGYKELELKGQVTFSVALQKLFQTASAQASLLLQGSGNQCWNDGDYTKWSLRFNLKHKTPVTNQNKVQEKPVIISMLGVGPITPKATH